MDDGLIEEAIKRFEAMGLDWHATETRKLVARVGPDLSAPSEGRFGGGR